MRYYDLYPKYVSVAERKRKAEKHVASLSKKGKKLKPVVIEGRVIAKTFWGKAWCDNLESYSDFENRLPRGRTYVRNGSVIDLGIEKGKIYAQVMGSSLYKVEISIAPMAHDKWRDLIRACSGKIDSLVELLQGKFSKAVMAILTEKENGLFPKPHEITMTCSCPDYADMCKHVAAVLYGVGAALDTQPEWLFVLRHVNHMDLISSASVDEALSLTTSSLKQLDGEDLSSLFGIEIENEKLSVPKKTTQAKKSPKKEIPVEEKLQKKKLDSKHKASVAVKKRVPTVSEKEKMVVKKKKL